MNCQNTQQKIKPFLDDLLSEDEYQTILAHLEACRPCKEYVGAIGSISYQLKELRELEVPEELPNTILFKLKQLAQENQASSSIQKKKPSAFQFMILIFILASLFFGFYYFKSHSQFGPKTESPIQMAETVPEKEPVSSHEAAVLFEQLTSISEALGPEQKAPVPIDSKTSTPVEEGSESPVISQTEAEIETANAIPIHWHLPNSIDSERKQLLDASSQLNIQSNNLLPELVVLFISSDKLGRFLEETKLIFPRSSPARDIEIQELVSLHQPVRVSIYFEKEIIKDSNFLHWHLSFTLPNEFKLFDIFREMNLSLDYDSEELLVLSVSSTKLEEFQNRVRTIEGLSPDFGKPRHAAHALISHPIRISIYLTKG